MHGRSPAIASASSRWPLPETPATAAISPARTVSETPLTATLPRSPAAQTSVELEHRRAVGPRVTLAADDLDVAAHHQRRERLRRRVGGLHGGERLPRAEHGDAVGDRLHLVQLVRDEDDRPPLRGHLPRRHEQVVRLVRRQHRRRLVEDQDARLLVQRLEDLHPLLLADGELPDLRVRIDAEAVALAELAHLRLDGARVDAELAAHAAPVAEHEVLRDAEPLDEAEVLVHHPDPGVDRLARRREVDLLAVERDRPRVRAVEAGEDVREGRLPGAVLAEQRVHLARGGLEVDAVVRDDAGEALRDAAHRDGGRRRVAISAPPARTGCRAPPERRGGSAPCRTRRSRARRWSSRTAARSSTAPSARG